MRNTCLGIQFVLIFNFSKQKEWDLKKNEISFSKNSETDSDWGEKVKGEGRREDAMTWTPGNAFCWREKVSSLLSFDFCNFNNKKW